MKIKLSKIQWEIIGKMAGWVKKASTSQETMVIYKRGDWNDPSMREIWDNNAEEWSNAPQYILDESVYSGGYDKITVEVEFYYESEEKPSQFSPGSPESCEIVKVIDPSGKDIADELGETLIRQMEDKLLEIAKYNRDNPEHDPYDDEDYWLNS